MSSTPVMPVTRPILYSFRRCPYAMRARLAIAKAGVAVELREVVLRDKPAALREVSPKATVPVLVLADGRVIEESFEIVQWAFEQNDPERWWPDECADLQQLVTMNDGEFKQNLDGYKYPERHPRRDGKKCRDAGEQWLAELDQRLQKSPWLAGPERGVADIALMPFVRQFVNTDAEWFATTPYRALDRWLKHWLESELFVSVMHKYPQWQPTDEPVLFP